MHTKQAVSCASNVTQPSSSNVTLYTKQEARTTKSVVKHATTLTAFGMKPRGRNGNVVSDSLEKKSSDVNARMRLVNERRRSRRSN